MRIQLLTLATASLACISAIPINAMAQTPPYDLRAAVEHAWERAAPARAAEGREEQAAASRAQAESFFAGSPAFGLSGRYGEESGATEHEVTLSAPIWVPGQRSARAGLADAEVEEAQTQREALRLALAGEVRARVWAVVAVAAEVEQAARRAEFARALETQVKRRVDAGDLAHADWLLARQETLSAELEQHEAERRLHEAEAALALLTGSDALPADYAEQPQPAADLDAHPRVRAARLAQVRADRRAAYVASSRRDPPEFGVLYRRERLGGALADEQSVGVTLRVPFATDARNRPQRAAAQAEASTAAAEARATLAAVRSEIALAETTLTHVETHVTLLERRVAAARERAALVRRAFNFGEQGLTELLRAQFAEHEAAGALARERAALGRARAQLNQARGLLP